MPARDLRALLERIHTRLDESFVGIGEMVSDLDAADLAELINQLTLAEAATVVSMLPVQRAIEISRAHGRWDHDDRIRSARSQDDCRRCPQTHPLGRSGKRIYLCLLCHGARH